MAAGDHIRVKRAFGAYYHHGIDAGNGTVIHFSGEPAQHEAAYVCRTPLDEFLKGGEMELVKYHDDTALLPPSETIARAEEQMGKRGYRLFRNNCEHFATYCRTGVSYSKQVQKFVIGAGMVFLAAGASVVGAYIRRKISGGKGAIRRA